MQISEDFVVTSFHDDGIMESESLSPTMRKIVHISRLALERDDSPLLWSIDVARCLDNAGIELPSVELGHTLVDLFFNLPPFPAFLSYLHQSMASYLVSSFHLLGLLLPRVLQARISCPKYYSIFLELTNTFIFQIGSTRSMQNCDMVIKAVDDALQLSQLFSLPTSDFGTTSVQFLLILMRRLLETTLEDWGVFGSQTQKPDHSMKNSNQQETQMDIDEFLEESQGGQREQIHNCIGAINLVSKIMLNKKTKCLLRVACHNLGDQWTIVTRCLQALETRSKDASFVPQKAALECIDHLLKNYQQGLCQELNAHQFPVAGLLLESVTHKYYVNSPEAGHAAIWFPIDIFMENLVAGRLSPPTFIVEKLADIAKALQLLYNALWQDIFLSFWISALRLLQRELDEREGPVPLSESRLSILLSIIPLVSALLIDEEEKQLTNASEISCMGSTDENQRKVKGHRRAALMSSLKILGQFEGLLSPPQNVAAAAHQAAVSAAACLAGFKKENMGFEGLTAGDAASGNRTVGNLRHLIVETCIARGLIDNSACHWPGYLGTQPGNLSISGAPQTSPWSTYMDGASLNGTLKNALINVPARSVSELEKLYQAAISGPEEERAAAASVLCGASLTRGWSVQEHAVSFVLRLLSPPVPTDSRAGSHSLVAHSPMLHATLMGISSNKVFHILSLYGTFPALAASLLPICEVFGSLPQSVGGSKEDISLFSLAFLTLIKILKYNNTPVQPSHNGTVCGVDMNLEYLLMSYNEAVASSKGSSEKLVTDDQSTQKRVLSPSNFLQGIKNLLQPSSQPIMMDSFPNLKTWLLQYQSCFATSFSGLPHIDSVRQVVDRLLGMMMKKSNKNASLPAISSATTTISGTDDLSARPLLPGWDLLTAVPFVVDALLTACGHGKLSPRDLTTGLKELVDFFPASLAGMITYLEAEVTRGVWKPVSMNGKDWPNPGANLSSIEAEIRAILNALGVNIPNLAGEMSGNAHATLPLPLAAFLSLTITYGTDKLSEIVLGLVGSVLQNLVCLCAPLSTCVVTALWSQKVRRWHGFIVFGAVQSAVRREKNAVIQLLKSCFAVTLGTSTDLLFKLTAHGGVGALLGHGSRQFTLGYHPPVSPGILYLRICPFLHDIMFLPCEILTLLVTSVRELSATGNDGSNATVAWKPGLRLRCSHPSLVTTSSRIAQASTLAASLLLASGGPILAKLLWMETLPTWFLVGQKSEDKSKGLKGGKNALLEGYAIAYFSFISGFVVWRVSQSKETLSLRKPAVAAHVKFLATALDGKVSVACDPVTWKAYVVAFISLLLSCAPCWISDVEVQSLNTIATALRMWHEGDLALSLLERGGQAAMGAAAEFVLSSFLG